MRGEVERARSQIQRTQTGLHIVHPNSFHNRRMRYVKLGWSFHVKVQRGGWKATQPSSYHSARVWPLVPSLKPLEGLFSPVSQSVARERAAGCSLSEA